MTTMDDITDQDKSRFDEKWEKDGDCWVWTAGMRNNYGGFHLIDRMFGAHQASYLIYNGPIGDSNVLHTCGNKKCVNPDHLYLGDQEDNIQDAIDGGTFDMTVLKQGKLTSSDVEKIRNNSDLTQSELADEYDISQSMVSRIKNGERW